MSEWLYVIEVIVVVVSAAAGVTGYFRANVSKSTIELYKEDNEALRARLKTVEEQVASDAVKLRALTSSRDYLASIVTQAESMNTLLTQQKEIKTLLDRVAMKVGA